MMTAANAGSSSEVLDWRALFDVASVYHLLSRLDPGPMFDVGAAVGMTTSWMLEHSPNSHVTAYEPFEGNWPHFERVHGLDDRVRLRKVAVGSRAGIGNLQVARVIPAGTGRWGVYAGGSSIGKLVEQGGTEVPVVRLGDDVGEAAVFVKIDVQGHEVEVLRGAEDHLAQHRIGLLFVEYNHTPEMLSLMSDHGYVCIDSEYVLSAEQGRDVSNWDIQAETVSSNGSRRFKAFPKERPSDAASWATWVKDEHRRIGSAWTNLLFVTPEALARLGRAG